MVTLPGSPPKLPMLSCTHFSAKTWSRFPYPPVEWSGSSFRSSGAALVAALVLVAALCALGAQAALAADPAGASVQVSGDSVHIQANGKQVDVNGNGVNVQSGNAQVQAGAGGVNYNFGERS